MLRLLPHALTLTNLAAGVYACVALARGDLSAVPLALLVSAVADFLDGFAARAAGVSGPFGRELDSLADVVSFGVSPGLMAWVMLAGGLEAGVDAAPVPLLAYAGLAIPLASAVRLARFNLEQADTKHFVGLATPSNALLWFGLLQTYRTDALGLRENLAQPAVLVPLIALSCYLLVSDLPLFSNKLDPRARRNWPVWVVLALALALPWVMGWAAVPVVVGVYVLSGLVWRPEPAASDRDRH